LLAGPLPQLVKVSPFLCLLSIAAKSFIKQIYEMELLFSYLGVLVILIALEGLLVADNAFVLAILVHHLLCCPDSCCFAWLVYWKRE